MTVETNDTVERYTISGIGPYAFSFRIFDDTDLTVSAIDSDLVTTGLTLSSHYSVTGANDEDGGAITLTADAASTYAGDTLDIRSNTVEYQPTSIRNQGRFLPEIHEDAFDRMVRQVQDLSRKVRSSLRYPDDGITDGVAPSVASRKGRYLFGNAVTGLFEWVTSIATTALSQSIFNQYQADSDPYKRTAAEIAAGVTPVNYAIPSHDAVGVVIVDRYGNNTTPGSTDMTAALQAAIKVALTGASVSGIGDHAKVVFRRNVYAFTQDSPFSNPLTLNRGIVFEGQGLASTQLKLITGGSAKYFFKNTVAASQDYLFVTFRDLMFATDSVVNGNGFYMQADQGWDWNRCWFYQMARVLEGNGSINGSEHKFFHCKITEIWNRVISFDNNQMLNIELHGCDVETIYGHIFYLSSGGGGTLRVFGGSYIMDDDSTAVPKYLLYIDGGNVGANNNTFNFYGIQTELHSTNNRLVFKGSPSSSVNIVFADCSLQNTQGGVRELVDMTGGNLVFRGGNVPPADTYRLRTTGTITWERIGNAGSIVFDAVQFFVPNMAALMITDTYGYVSARDCHYDAYDSGVATLNRYAVDFDVNWFQTARGIGFPGLKTVCLKTQNQLWPYTGDGGINDWTLNLPDGARIKNIYVFRPANGSGGAGNVQLAVGNGDKTTTYASSTLAAGTAEHSISVEQGMNALIAGGITNPNNQVRIWGSTTNTSIVDGGFAIVQYF